MRTKGTVEFSAYHDMVSWNYRMFKRESDIQAKANAVHMSACWKAIEQHCGGKPEVVGEMFALVRDFCNYYEGEKALRLGNGKAFQFYDRARAILAKIGK